MIIGHLTLDNDKVCEAVEYWLDQQTYPGHRAKVMHCATIVESGAMKFKFALVKPKVKPNA